MNITFIFCILVIAMQDYENNHKSILFHSDNNLVELQHMHVRMGTHDVHAHGNAYACMNAHAHSRTHARTHARTHEHKHTCTHGRACMHTHTCAHAHACTHTHGVYVPPLSPCACSYVPMHVHAHMCPCMHVHGLMCMHAHMYPCM